MKSSFFKKIFQFIPKKVYIYFIPNIKIPVFVLFALIKTTSFSQTTITIGTQEVQSSIYGDSPYNYYWESRRIQFVYTKAEINTNGQTGAANLTAIAWDVSQVNGGNLINYTIKIAHTTSSDAAAHNSASLTTVKNAHTLIPGSTGWRTITFDTPFSWNGNDNILVDVCWGVNSGYSSTGRVYVFNNVANQIRTIRDVSSNMCSSTTTTSVNYKPRVQLTFVASCTTPTSYTVSGTAEVCNNGETSSITLSGSQVGVNYQLKRGGTNVGSAIAGTGSALNLGNHSTVGTYTVEATGTGSFCVGPTVMTGNAVITTIHCICPGQNTGSVTFNSGSGTGTDSYQVSINNGSTWSSYTPGNAINTTGASGYVKVRGTRSGACGSDFNEYTVWKVIPGPSAPIVGTITQPTCAVATGSVALSGLPAASWTITANPGGATITGSTTTANFSGLTAGQSYTFTLSNAAGCASVASTSAAINAQPQPATTITGIAIPDGSYLWSGNTSDGWATASNWYRRTGSGYVIASNAPETTRNIYIFPNGATTCISSNRPRVDANPVTAQNLYIASGAVLGFNVDNSLDVYGNFTNLGSLANDISTNQLSGNRIIRFRGGSNQNVISGGTNNVSGPPLDRKWFHHIEINKTGGNVIIVDYDLQFSGNLTMTGGNLALNGRKLIMSETASIVNEANNKRIFGTSGTVETTRTFGSFLSSENFGNIGIIVSTAVAPGVTTIKRGHTQQIGIGNNGSIYRYFDILPATNTGLNATLTMNFFDNNEIPGSFIKNNFKFYRSIDNGVTWEEKILSTVNTTSNFVQLTGIPSFSRWTISDYLISPLPVSFLGMQTDCEQGGKVIIKWQTASEINAHYFDIERSVDGINWLVVGRVDAKGNTSYISNYSFTDGTVPSNFKGYYRLRQFDFDGEHELFAPAYAHCIGTGDNIFGIFPNPSDGNVYIYINAANYLDGEVELALIDGIGRVVQKETLNIHEGSGNFHINFQDKQSGMYYLQITFNNGEIMGTKLIKN
jgi:hypothetical protein